MGTFKLILGIAAMVAAIIACVQVIPPEMANFQFQDDLKEVAVLGGSNPNKTDEDLRNAVLLKAKAHDIALTPEQVSVQRIGQPGLAGVYLQADYSVPVNLPGYSLTLHFTPNSGNR
ncbi:MAG TPA: hypothetical protein VKR60_14805 [Candidatus Sulfotelmatobacter sp.]|nr:hypothetical protein [Candidatus Sulfotelmatobacter sp.]